MVEQIQGERCPEAKVVKCSELRIEAPRLSLAPLRWGNHGRDRISKGFVQASVEAGSRIDRSLGKNTN